jgi:hypothetical protein
MINNFVVILKNRYPKGKVIASDSAIDCYVGSDHKVALRKDGAGQWVCQSAELGCSDVWSLAPIPKDARIHKLVNGKVALDPEHEERRKLREEFIHGDRVLSCEELKAKGYRFDEKQRVEKRPAQKAE